MICLDARAAGPLGEDGEDLETSSYHVDPSQSVVLGSTRVVGLAGAFVAIGEGVDGTVYNPAAPAVRASDSFAAFDYSLRLDFSLPSAIPGSNVFNSGFSSGEGEEESEVSGFVFFSVAANVQLDRWGLGVTAEAERYQVRREAAGFQTSSFSGNFGVVHLMLARAVDDGNWAVGAGPILTGVSFLGDGFGDLFSAQGFGAEAGLLYKPNWQPYRIGLSVRSPVTPRASGGNAATTPDGDIVAGEGADAVFLPEGITMPWQASAGFAWQFGPKPFNPRWIHPEEAERRFERTVGEFDDVVATEQEEAEWRAKLVEKRSQEWLEDRFRRMQRFYVLVSTALVVYGPAAADAITVQGFATQTVERSSDTLRFSPRLGIESGVVPTRLRLRAGSYLEPTRVATSGLRVHATGGFDLRLFDWSLFGLLEEDTGWQLSTAVDGAQDYLNAAISVGTWR